MAATSVTGVGYGAAMTLPFGRNPGVKASKVIWVEGDDGTVDLGSIPGVSQQDIYQASMIITDAGRVLKDRHGEANRIIPSFDLVKTAEKKKGKAPPSKYRSIFEPSDIKEDI